MKTIKILLRKTLLVLALAFFASSCNKAFLDEVPKGFLSPENSYTDLAGFETAITTLHSNVRDFYTANSAYNHILFGIATDFGIFGENLTGDYHTNFSAITPTDVAASMFWTQAFTIVKNANVIISRAESANVKWNSASDKALIIAEAKFYRAWAYRLLANLYGGVPIIKSEINSPKIDFVRNTLAEVYQFAKEDLTFAAANLPDPDAEKAPGRITKGAANHLLAEIDICLKDYQGAIDAASKVISNPSYKLMTTRFGKRTSVAGDVFWDMFQIGNQNRSSGNKESIWVLQVEYNVTGGSTGYAVERAWGARYHSIKDPNGSNGFILSDELGRPVAWVLQSNYLQQTIWQSNWDDMRNSTYNVKRQYYYNDPTSKYFGQLATQATLASQELRFYQPTFMKCTTPFNHPDGIVNSGVIWRDVYAMRLAETYLLRAEAFLGKGDQVSAAADLNVVRARANAAPVAPSTVDINFILDERARELVTEEFRTCTLQRLGLLYERTKNLSNLLLGDGSIVPSVASKTVQSFNNLWPIPQTEIDLNGGSKLEQNPGYK